MSSTNFARMTDAGPPVPAMGTYPAAANKLFPKGTIVQLDASDRAIPGADANGFHAVGVSNATYDNRTGSEAGGLAGDLDVDVCFGVFAFDVDGTPAPGSTVWVKDNQTVSDSSAGSTRGVAGVCIEIRTLNGVSQCLTWMGPHVAALFSDASALEADLITAQGEVADLLVDVVEGHISVPLPMAPAFANGTVNGLDPTVMGFRLNNAVDDQPFRVAIALPDDIDAASDVIVTARAYIIDDAVDDDVVLVLVAKFDGGADVAPVSATVLGEAAAEISFTLDAGDVPAGAKALYLELDCAATLDTSDAVVEALQVTFTKTLASA